MISSEVKENKEIINNRPQKEIFSDVEYICKSTALIIDSLQKGMDVVQLPSGDIIATEIRTVNIHYTWDKDKKRMLKISQVH